MKDWQFYPLIIAFVVAMVAYALSLANYDDVARTSGLTLQGESLSGLYAAEGLSYSIASEMNNPAAYAVLSAHVSREKAPKSAGIFVTLGPKDEKAFAGQLLRITVTARAGRTAPLDQFEIAYFTAGAGDSAWQTFVLTDEFADYAFEYTPNFPNGDPGNDYVGIWPDVDGEERTVEVKAISIEILPNATQNQ